MTPHLCPRETEVLDLIAIGQWPRRADEALRAHVVSCGACAEAALVALVMTDAEPPDVRVPDSGVVWLRAQFAARDVARRRAARPLWLAQLAASVVLAAGVAIWWGGAAGWLLTAISTARSGAAHVFASDVWAAEPSGSPFGGTARWALGAAVLAGALVVPLALGLSRLADGGDES